jgi:hypothetical protein
MIQVMGAFLYPASSQQFSGLGLVMVGLGICGGLWG